MTDGRSKIRDSEESDSDVPPQSKRGRRRVNVICDSDDSDTGVRRTEKPQAAGNNDFDSAFVNATKDKSRKQSVRVPWSDEDLDLLKKAFGHCLRGGMLPGYAAIKEAQKRFPTLQSRTLPQIKSRFYHLQKMLHK